MPSLPCWCHLHPLHGSWPMSVNSSPSSSLSDLRHQRHRGIIFSRSECHGQHRARSSITKWSSQILTHKQSSSLWDVQVILWKVYRKHPIPWWNSQWVSFLAYSRRTRHPWVLYLRMNPWRVTQTASRPSLHQSQVTMEMMIWIWYVQVIIADHYEQICQKAAER